jgi:hypothetical protein
MLAISESILTILAVKKGEIVRVDKEKYLNSVEVIEQINALYMYIYKSCQTVIHKL